MSIDVITAVLNLSPETVTPSERLVLYVLAWHAKPHGGDIWPAVGTIARETSLSRRAVQKILPRLLAKQFVFVDSLQARRAVCYGLNLEALHRERYSQSPADDYERGSQSGNAPEVVGETTDCEPRSPHREHGSPTPANDVRAEGEPRSPDPSLNRHSEPSGKKSTDAAASVPTSVFDKGPRGDGPSLKQLEALAHDEWVAGRFDQQGESMTLIADFSEAVKQRAARLSGFDYAVHVDRLNCAVFNVQMQRSRQSAHAGNGRRVGGFTRVGAL